MSTIAQGQAPARGAVTPPADGLARGVLAAGLVLGFALRLWLALSDDGLYWPDEIYQSLEPAHRLAFGYGLVAWEFVEGARNWAFPGLLAGALRACAWLGMSEPRQYLAAIRILFCGVGTATAWAAYRLARALGTGSLSAACGAALFSLGAPLLYFAPRSLSETASALPAVVGLALALPPQAHPRARTLGASLLGVAALLRLQLAALGLSLVLVLAARKQFRAALQTLGVLAAWAVIYGALDKLTWGGWFHSALVYLRFNLVEGRAAQWGTADFSYYARTLFRCFPLGTSCLLGFGILSARRAPGLLFVAASFFVLHSLIPHKELRFILPVLPLGCALCAVGLEVAGRWVPSGAGQGAVLAAALVSGAGFRRLTFGDLGQYENSRPNVSAYDDSGPVNRLLLAAHDLPDLCGLKIETVHLAWTGGYSYLHRPVPLYPHTGPPRSSGLFNYVITFAPWVQGGRIAETDGPLALVRLPVPACRPDPGYSWRLP